MMIASVRGGAAARGVSVSANELRASDLHAILTLLAATNETATTDEFAEVLLAGLSGVVRCDLISYNEIDLIAGATQTYFEPSLVPRPALEQAFANLIHQHPLVREYAATRDPHPLLLSNFVGLSELRRLELYHEVFRPLETNYQLAFSLAVESDTVLGIGLNRRARDFSARDMAAMALLQPHLTAAYLHCLLRQRGHHQQSQTERTLDRLALLTPREQEVAALVISGCSNRQVARMLLISQRTAEKHLANIFSKLGVLSRVEMTVLLGPSPPS